MMRTATSGTGNGTGNGMGDRGREDTLQLVRDNVRKTLSRSPSFRALPPDQQRQVAHDTVKVARFMADAGGETAGLPMTAIISNPAMALAAPARPFAPPARPNP